MTVWFSKENIIGENKVSRAIGLSKTYYLYVC